MLMNIGKKIRELRLQNGLTQTEMAEIFGISPQAVSRWEIGVAYPDLELIPAVANYFGVTIDDLFGYQSERETRVNAILDEARALARYDNGVDVNIEKCLTLLRNGLVEFPRNEKIMCELAKTLSNAGWVRCGEHITYNDDGYLVHKVAKHLENEYWSESVKLFETIIAESKDPALLNDSAYHLALLYCNLGQYEKGLALAERMPPVKHARELMRAYATDGADRNGYLGEALLHLAGEFSQVMVQTLMSKSANFESDLPVRMLTETIHLFETLFEGGVMGRYHMVICDLLLYLSEHQWRCGMHDEAFASLDKALEHTRKFEALARSEEADPKYTASLLNGISMGKERWLPLTGTLAADLPDFWPIWMEPDFKDIKTEITADPRWADWVKRAKEN